MVTLLAVIYVVFISLGFPDSLFGVAWPVVHQEFQIAESFASFYSIITGVCTGGVSFIAGKVIRKFGTANVTFFSTLLTAIGLTITSIAPNIVVMMLGTVVLGYGAGVIDTALNNFVSLHYKAQHMNWLHAFWGVGVTVSPLIMSLFLNGEAGNWRNGYRVVAFLQLLIAGIILLSLKKWKKVKDSTDADDDKPAENKSLFEIVKIKGVVTSVVSQGLYCSMEFILGTWGASYLVNVHALMPDEAAKWISLYWGGIMVGRFIAGFISLRASDNAIIRGGVSLSIIGMLLLALPLGKVSLVGLLLVGIGFGPVFPSILHSVPTRFGIKYSADITGIHMGGAYGIGFFVQLSFGFIATSTTFAITPFILLGLAALFFVFNEKTILSLKKIKADF